MAVTFSAPVAVASRRPVYVGLSVLMASIAIVGFWRQYFGPLVLGTLNADGGAGITLTYDVVTPLSAHEPVSLYQVVRNDSDNRP
jgi:hypothetical protein